MCRNILRAVYLVSVLTSKSGGSEVQTQEEVWVEEEGLAGHFHFHPQSCQVRKRNSSTYSVHLLGEK